MVNLPTVVYKVGHSLISLQILSYACNNTTPQLILYSSVNDSYLSDSPLAAETISVRNERLLHTILAPVANGCKRKLRLQSMAGIGLACWPVSYRKFCLFPIANFSYRTGHLRLPHYRIVPAMLLRSLHGLHVHLDRMR